MENIVIQEKPFGISIVPIEGIKITNVHSKISEKEDEITDFYYDLHRKTKKSILCRGTAFANLNSVITTGIDVTPMNSVIFCDRFPQKALEYGWNDRGKNARMILLFYNSEKLQRSFIEKSSTISQEDYNEISKIYPSIEKSIDGSRIWFSRLNINDKRRATEYETEYGFWIPENPFEALVWVMLIGDFNEREILGITAEIQKTYIHEV